MSQELQNEIIQLKAQLFDASREMQMIHESNQQQNEVLTEIVEILDIQPSEDGKTVLFSDIINAVKMRVDRHDSSDEFKEFDLETEKS